MNGMPMGGGPNSPGRERRRPGDAAKLFGWLLRETQCRALDAAYIALACALMAVLSILVPALIGRAIDGFRAPEQTARALVPLVAFNLLIALLGNRQGIAIPRLTQRMSHRLRRMLHAKLLRLPVSYVDAHPHGDLMSRLTNDSESVAQALSTAIPGMITSVITLLGCVFIMLRISPVIALMNLAVGFAALLPCSLLSRRIFAAAQRQQQALGALNAAVTDGFSRRGSILVADSAGFACAEVARASGDFARKAERMQILAGIMEPMMSLIGSFSFVATILIGLGQVSRGAMTVGLLQACLIYARQVLRPFIDAGRTVSQLQGCLASIGRLREILELPAEADEGAVATPGAGVRGEIDFEHVDFSYTRDRQLYRDLSLHIPAGKTTAIIGETGAGKTTLLNLLLRFYAPQGGRVLLDGVPVEEWTKRRLYGSIAVILQDQDTTADTVLESITYGCPGASREEALEAARKVRAGEIVDSLPRGLDTPLIGDSVISAGQRQLIALARVPLSDARVLIFDEATSSVDSYTEQRIQQAFAGLRAGRTCVVIAHRLSTIRGADRIVVMHEGQVAECGTHEELLARNGRYRAMIEEMEEAEGEK